MDFILGCNYWASNAGADMWRCFDANAIEKDIKTLSEYGITHIRAFGAISSLLSLLKGLMG